MLSSYYMITKMKKKNQQFDTNLQLNVSARINQNKDRHINTCIAEYFFKFLIILKQFIKESNLKWLLELVKSKHIFIKKNI